MRSGAAHLHIVDSGAVSPGVLSRQPYEDADIGQPKAEVLAGRLSRIRPQTKITALVADIIDSDLFTKSGLSQYDLIIDATANRSVAAKIERAQREQHALWPTLITVAISQRATHGVAAVTPRGTTGAGVDLLRRLGLRTCTSTALRDVYAAFFPPEESRLNFRPDTSCSDTTFIGSSTDMSALAAQLLHGALVRSEPETWPRERRVAGRSLSIVRLSYDDELKTALVALDLPPTGWSPTTARRTKCGSTRPRWKPFANTSGRRSTAGPMVPVSPPVSCSVSSTARAASRGSHRRPACRQGVPPAR